MTEQRQLKGNWWFWSKVYLSFCRDAYKSGAYTAAIYVLMRWPMLAYCRATQKSDQEAEKQSPFTYTMH